MVHGFIAYAIFKQPHIDGIRTAMMPDADSSSKTCHYFSSFLSRVSVYCACRCRLITIHNHPDNLKPPAGFKHLKFTLADIDTADIAPAFGPTFDFIEGARSSNQGRVPTPGLFMHLADILLRATLSC